MNKYKSIKIGSKKIGFRHKPFIIAEAGINHNGDFHTALKMIETAKNAGADAVKFQTFKAEEFIADPSLKFTYFSQGKKITESMQKMFKRAEFSKNEWKKIKKKCDKEKIMFLSSPGATDFTNIPFLKECSKTNLPLILSSGMADLSEIFSTLNTIGSFDGYPTILFLTTSEYPTPKENVNLLKLDALAKTFPMITLGFSDHTRGFMASSIAVAFGARVFEKHFTLNNSFFGPDHWFSENPDGLKKWVESIHNSYKMLGSPILKPTNKEIEMRSIAQKSVVALRSINKGEKFNSRNISVKRPGIGLPPLMLTKIIGMTATRKIKQGELLRYGDFND